jgi:hypothetical protein
VEEDDKGEKERDIEESREEYELDDLGGGI